MASTLTTSTNYAVATGNIREDLSDIITNIAPTDTPFMSAIGKGTCNNTTPSWLIDTLDAAAANTAVEGADVSSSYAAETAAVRTSNICQISTKLLEISGTLEATTLAGRKSEIKYQLGIKMKELARDMEYNLLNNEYSASSPRVMRGLVDWLNDSNFVTLANNYYAFGGTYATTNLLTEDILNDGIQGAWTEGGKVNMALASPVVKRTISGFNGSNKLTVNADQTEKKVINTVDFYESDFGMIAIKPERFWAADADSGNNYDKLAILETDKWETLYLRPVKTEKMAKVGDSERTMIVAEYTLKTSAPKANHLIEKIYRA
jgi:hypothetical protein